MTELKVLDASCFEQIRELFRSVFTAPPWNDDWSDEKQLDEYLRDLMGARTPVTLGLTENGNLIGVSLGYIKHWYSGTEYVIDELCIRQDRQRLGLGTLFLSGIENYLKKRDVYTIYLTTERNVPARSFYLKNGFTELPDQIGFYKTFRKEKTDI